MDDRGELKWFLGIDFKRTEDGNYNMNQERYAEAILKRFNLTDAKTASTPPEKSIQLQKTTNQEYQAFLSSKFPYRQAVGSLIYLSATRPDISWTISKLSQYLDKPSMKHVAAVKHLVRYEGDTLPTKPLCIATHNNPYADNHILRRSGHDCYS
ncbi:uncharacterized protein [Watersipora subatra]|uniref:uncharacterized protein n=1 Tax=Watersipora subatra TaxID=2589382 RepID=UPI00355BD7AD